MNISTRTLPAPQFIAFNTKPSVVKHARLSMAAWRQRRFLARLSDDALNDIGVSRIDARAEAKRPIWDVPANWVRK